MKKLYRLFLSFSLFLLYQAGISQSSLQKTELFSSGESGDTRFNVTATVMDNDTWCRVEWPDPVYTWELAYDDGEVDDIFVYNDPGCQSANKFSPTGYPFLVTGGRVNVWNGSFPGPFIGVTFRVLVYDDDGENELPGTVLDSIDVTVNNYEWVEFEGLTAEITEGDFYLAIKQLTEPPEAVPVGVDMDNPTYFISYSYLPGLGWVTSPLQDFMIRAWIHYYNEPLREIDYFEVARFSGFGSGESPLDGDTLILDIITESGYDDYDWTGLEPGLYAYGVRTHFTSGVWSDYDVSNVVTHSGDGHPLPFLEQWIYGNFETNNWMPEGENWSLNGWIGNPPPAAQFTWDPIQNDYQIALESYPFLADSMTEGQIYLDFDIRLDNVNPTGNEEMHIQAWNWDSQEWTTVSTYSNIDGSFGWLAEHLDITSQAIETVFKIRFLATGENSLDILGWYVDNIHVYRECKGPNYLTAWFSYQYQGIALNWNDPYGPNNQWIHWDDGVNSGNSIGTGSEIEFDVASRWIPSQLAYYDGFKLTQIAFFPAEAQASYNVRVWVGSNAANLVVDQPVVDPVIDHWNYITLDSSIMIDITQELWVGYYVNTLTGFPAGVDDGPAIDGYGNMMNFGGWQTLLQVNPALDHNWNIKAYIQQTNNVQVVSKYGIYRSDDVGPFYLRAFSDTNYFLDDYAICENANLHCYKVTAIYEGLYDTCESQLPYWDACEICWKINENDPDFNVKIYPNPASDVIFIESSEKLESVCIFDSRGVALEHWNAGTLEHRNTGTQELPLRGLAPGLYLLRVETKSGVVGRKVVVR